MTEREKKLFKVCLEIILDESSSKESIKDAKMYIEILKDRM